MVRRLSFSAPVPASEEESFKQKIFSWLQRFEIACYLDHNGYQGYAGNEFEVLVAVGMKDQLCLEQEAGAFDRLKEFADATGDWLFGFLSYDLKNDVENLHSSHFDGIGFPNLHFFQPLVILELAGSRITIRSLEEDPAKVYRDILATTAITTPHTPEVSKEIPKLKSRFTQEEYLSTVEAIRGHIQRGDIYEMNFCQEFYIDSCQIWPPDIFLQLNRISRAPFSAYYRHGEKYLMCASPERFLKKKGEALISQPIKGTIRRGDSPQEDQALITQLFNSAKDRSENVMIVDLVRNDLSRACDAGTVRVEELFGVYTFEQVHHLISTITGRLKPGTHWVDAIRLAFPMGSMTGAPKVRSMELIETFERTKRGLYSGALGYVTPDGDFDLNVVIRSMLYNQLTQYLSFQVGGAIVFDSVPETEYEECLLKAKGLRTVLQSIKK